MNSAAILRGTIEPFQELPFFMSDPVKITVRPNGSLRVEGPITLCDAEGREWDLTGKPAISLCRCGGSANRPFCDGSHKTNGFQCQVTPPAEPAAT